MKGSISDLMQQAQKMQADMQKAQEELANVEVRGESGAGLVTVIMTGRHDVKRVSIDDAVLEEDKEVLEDLLAAAVNDVLLVIHEF
jgi:DNA-binding YbaB/EbfC family protein